MRGKEQAHDYRYFPDPDLVPLIVEDDWITKVKEELPELPDAKRNRFINTLNLSEYDASVLTSSIELATYFEQTINNLQDIKQAANWIMTTLLAMLNTQGISISKSPITPNSFSKLLKLLESGKINANAAKLVFDEMLSSSKPPEVIVNEKGLEQLSDSSSLETLVADVIKKNPSEVDAYRAGKNKLFSFFMGQIMKETRGKADPKIVTKLLKETL